MYNVVFRTTLVCETTGALTWTSFNNKEDFDQWYDRKMREWYEVVDEGVSKERATELCSKGPIKGSNALFVALLRSRFRNTSRRVD